VEKKADRQYVIEAIGAKDSWRMFRIMSEFVDGFETMSDVTPAVSIFGSARAGPDDEYYLLTERLAGELAKNGIGVITGGGGAGAQSLRERQALISLLFLPQGDVRQVRARLRRHAGRLRDA
jgi:hypothetical protein